MASLRSFLEPLLPFFVVYLAVIAVEGSVLAYRRRRGRRDMSGYEWQETTNNVASWITAMVAWIPIHVATYVASYALWQYRVIDLGTGVVGWLVAALAWDFSFYWQHRAEHEIRVLWAGHVTHHSGERFNYSTSPRQSWTPWTGPLFYAGWALAGV